MKHVRQLCLLILCSLMLSPLGAQTIDPEAYPGEKAQQQQEFLDGESAFPAKPRSKWSLGLKGGAAYVTGDVAAQPGYGFGLDFRRGLGHAVSLRLQATGGQAKGLNYQPNRGYRNHSGNPWSDLYFPGQVNQIDQSGLPPQVYYNFQMTYADLSVQAVINLNNINFYKAQPNWGLHAILGAGVLAFSTKVDAGREANGVVEPYDFSAIDNIALGGGALSLGGRRDRIDALTNILDGTYETAAEGSNTATGITVGSNNFTTQPVIMAGLGGSYRLNDRIDIELEHRFVWTNNDLLDGQRWQEAGSISGAGYARAITPLTPDKDAYQQTTIGIHFRLGKGEEADWWRNPMHQVYNGIEESREVVRKISEDSDNDGIPDLYDKEPDTPEGMMVDASGKALDSDGDGIPDSEDDEPFTIKGSAVDRNGVALDADNDGVPDVVDKEPNSAPGMYYDANGVAIQMPDVTNINNNAFANSPCLLPIIHFDLDQDNIKPDFYPELYYIAQVMKANPELKVKAAGYTDSRNSDAYNQDLSERRVENAVSFIVNTYGIEGSRFVTDALGEGAPLIPNLPDDRANPKLEPLHFVNRRVEFECIKN